MEFWLLPADSSFALILQNVLYRIRVSSQSRRPHVR